MARVYGGCNYIYLTGFIKQLLTGEGDDVEVDDEDYGGEADQSNLTQLIIFYLVGGIPTPLKNMTSSVGMMTFPIYGKIKHVPNHATSYLQKLRVDVIGVGTIIPEMLALDTQPFRSTDFPGQQSSTTKTQIPSGKHTKSDIENGRNSGFTHEKW